jgi:hypothetical protein
MKQLAALLFVVFVSFGCSTEKPPPQARGQQEWKRISDSLYKDNWAWVCLASGRMDDGTVRLNSRGEWAVFVRGGGYGEFETKEQGQHQAERMFKLKGLSCP